MKKIYVVLVMLLCMSLVFTGCEKDEEIQPEPTLTTTPEEADVSGTSVDALQAYVDQLIEEGYSEEDAALKLQEYIKDHNEDAKGVRYTYTVSDVYIGSWMLCSDNIYDRAHWLDSWIYEPITNMWKDKVSTSESAALQRVTDHLERVGYGLSSNHSYAYWGCISGTYDYNAYGKKTWSDDYWWNDNNHGRVFGPVKVGSYWVTLGAFSRETGIWHKFINFYEARNKASNYSSYFPTRKVYYSGNTWEDGNCYLHVRIKD